MSSAKLWRTKLLRKGRFLAIFVIILSWLFSGFPRVWQNPRIPPEIQEQIKVLEKTKNKRDLTKEE